MRYPYLMKNCSIGVVYLLCLCLGGCKSMRPNPQVEDTMVMHPPVAQPYVQKSVKGKAKVVVKKKETAATIERDMPTKFYDGLYDPQEVVAKIFFAFDSFALSERDKSLLKEKVFHPMKGHSDKTVLLVGHSDWRGAAFYNDRLGENRASTVAQYLMALGFPSERIETISLGNRYATPNLSKSEGIKDRRCDIVFLDN